MGLVSTLLGERIRAGKRYFYIISRGSKRILKSGGMFSSSFGTIYSIMDTKSIFTNSYPDAFLPLPRLYAKPKVLVIGLGGGTIPYQLTKIYGDNISIDVAEIDEAMVRVSKRFLLGREQKWSIHVKDGLDFVEHSDCRYDIIILDAYNEDVMPAEFISAAFVEAASKALTKEGILAINMTTGIPPEHYGKLISVRFDVSVYPSEAGNSFILGSKHFKLDEIKAVAKRLSAQKGSDYLTKVYGGTHSLLK